MDRIRYINWNKEENDHWRNAFQDAKLACCPCEGWIVQGSETLGYDFIIAGDWQPRSYSLEWLQMKIDQTLDDWNADPFGDWLDTWSENNVPTGLLGALVYQWQRRNYPKCQPGCKKRVSLISWKARRVSFGPPQGAFDKGGWGTEPDIARGRSWSAWAVWISMTWKIDYAVYIDCQPANGSPAEIESAQEAGF